MRGRAAKCGDSVHCLRMISIAYICQLLHLRPGRDAASAVLIRRPGIQIQLAGLGTHHLGDRIRVEQQRHGDSSISGAARPAERRSSSTLSTSSSDPSQPPASAASPPPAAGNRMNCHLSLSISTSRSSGVCRVEEIGTPILRAFGPVRCLAEVPEDPAREDPARSGAAADIITQT